MADTPQLSGKDLARLALQNARAGAKTTPPSGTGPSRTRTKRTRRRSDGRDPITLATAITALGADIPLDTGIAGGNIIDQWPHLCPQYADTVQPVAYDPDRGRLDLRPANYAVASGLRLLGAQLAKQINDKTGRIVVRSIRVLPVGTVSQPDAYTAVHTSAPTPEAPVKTRETAHPGYRATLEAAQAHRPNRQPTDPYLVEALARQEAALRANRQPASEDRDAHWAQADAEQKTGPAPGSIKASIRAAIARKHQDQTGAGPRRLFGAA